MEEGAGGRGKESEAAAGAAGTAEAVREEEKDMESVGEQEWSELEECKWSNRVESD